MKPVSLDCSIMAVEIKNGIFLQPHLESACWRQPGSPEKSDGLQLRGSDL